MYCDYDLQSVEQAMADARELLKDPFWQHIVEPLSKSNHVQQGGAFEACYGINDVYGHVIGSQLEFEESASALLALEAKFWPESSPPPLASLDPSYYTGMDTVDCEDNAGCNAPSGSDSSMPQTPEYDAEVEAFFFASASSDSATRPAQRYDPYDSSGDEDDGPAVRGARTKTPHTQPVKKEVAKASTGASTPPKRARSTLSTPQENRRAPGKPLNLRHKCPHCLRIYSKRGHLKRHLKLLGCLQFYPSV